MTATDAAPARDHRGRVLQRDAADRDERKPVRSRSAAARTRAPLETDRVVAGRLGRGAEHRPDGDVAHRFAQRAASNCVERMRRQPDDRVAARRRRRTAAGDRSSWPTCTPSAPASRRHVGAVVDDDRRRRCRRASGDDGVEAVAGTQPLGSVLARSCRKRAPPSRKAAARSRRRQPPALRRVTIARSSNVARTRTESRRPRLTIGRGASALRPPRRGGRRFGRARGSAP